MRTRIRHLAAAAAALLGSASCVDFSGPGIDQNPNAAQSTSINVLFTGFQGYQFANLTGDNNRVVSVWMQHMAGTGRQWLQYDAPYLNSENLFGTWSSFYANGGLRDLRIVRQQARAINDQVYEGIAMVWEAYLMGTVADYWGAAPYSEAVDSTKAQPKFDTQRAIYTRVQAVLDTAITRLGGTGNGPNFIDLVYGGDKQKWIRAARTLKARYYLHVSPVDNTAMASALANAQQGIASAADDWRTYHSSTEGEQNQWFQFRRQRGTDIGGARRLIDLMQQRGDPRLPTYFAPVGANTFRGALPGEEDETVSWLSATRADPAFRQPMITWAENQLILAEAQQRGGQDGAALVTLNGVRQWAGLEPLTGLTGQPLLRAILEEKYVSLFQNPEAWDLYKRYCYPNFPMVNGATSFPMRLVYGANENATNRANVPSPEPRRNEVNVTPVTTSVDGTACAGQR